MSERRPAHDRKRHNAGRSRDPRVNAGACWDDVEGAAGVPEETERHEGIADMQDQEQSFRSGAVSGPAPEANEVYDSGGCERDTGPATSRPQDPEDQRDGADSDGQHVEARERNRQRTLLALCYLLRD
jgi:hypothetical protein